MKTGNGLVFIVRYIIDIANASGSGDVRVRDVDDLY